MTLTLTRIKTNVSGMVRNDTMEGRDYLVVPMIMMVEGVLNGSGGPKYYPAEELEKVPQVWNHKPVVVYHPEMHGKALSACDPDIITTHKIGVIMNTTFDGTRLRAEAWLEPDRIAIVDNRVQVALDNSTMMELSTGLFTENEATPGMFGEVPYDGIARNLRPDHLAILPDQIGACSIEDGAGFLRVNARNKNELEKVLQFLGVQNELSHSDIREQIRIALPKTEQDMTWIEDVFEDWFVSEQEGKSYKQNYSIKNDIVSLEGLRSEVVRKTVYEDRVIGNLQKGDMDMKLKEMVDAIVDNTEFAEEDRDFLMGLKPEQLEKMLPKANAEGETPPAEEEPAPVKKEETVTVIPEVEGDVTDNQTAEEFIANAPAEIREVLKDGLSTHAQKKTSLIAAITANEKNIFTKEQLASMSVNELTAIAALAKADGDTTPIPDYGGMGPVDNATGEDAEEPLVPVVMNFDKEQA